MEFEIESVITYYDSNAFNSYCIYIIYVKVNAARNLNTLIYKVDVA